MTPAVDRLAARRPLVLSGLRGGAKAWLVSALAGRVEAPLVVLAESHQRAEELHHDIAYFSGAEQVFHFPAWDTIPYDIFSPTKEVVAQRMVALHALLEGRCPVLVTSVQAMMQGMIPPDLARSVSFELAVGQSYPRRELLERLVGAGYTRVDLVEAPGEFSARGEIVDVFPIQAENPFRLDFFDDELETMRIFAVETQKSFRDSERVAIPPACEGVLNSATSARALAALPDYKSRVQPELYRQLQGYLQQASSFPGVEQMLPLLYDRPGRLHEALDPESILLLDEAQRITQRSHDFFEEVLREHEQGLEQGNLVVPPESFFLSPGDFRGIVAGFYSVELLELGVDGGPDTLVCPFADNSTLRSAAAAGGKSAHATLAQIVEGLEGWRRAGAPIFLAARSATGAERLSQLLGEFELGCTLPSGGAEVLAQALAEADGGAPPGGNAGGEPGGQTTAQATAPAEPAARDIAVLENPPRRGFRLLDENGETRFALITEEELLGEKVRQRRLKKSNLQHFVASLADLKEGDLVVHLDYGVGRYEGLRKLQAGQEQGDFLVLQYAGEDKVYVPVHRLNQVQKFTGVEGAAPVLNKLGDGAWHRSKQRASRIIEDMAEELVRVQASRKSRQGHAFPSSDAMMTEFEEAFPFQETEDQQRAIEEVLADMAGETPMDRLVCGDVGFGKTEVAMRAAYLAVLDKKQVLMLVPTTILAQQHYETFRQRCAEFALSVEVLSRFRSPQEQKKVLKEFGEGKVDILIGTHRLLSKDVQPKDLGLLVIDEEQRFGVAHKEKIKQFRTQVDVITLSATPIPRTLHMSLMGVRDLSIINTPPMDRLAIRTRLVKASDYMVREAVEREVRRGGQVFLVHNRVENIHAYGAYLQSILPNVRMGIAHGQMAERELEEVMVRFISGDLNLLLTTSIIESGLDIPRAYTIIINNAEQFGLAQLYQLRGRVGRSNLQAYAYLLVSPEKVLTEVAQKRLTLLQELNDLGSGFKIASHDLEIRGAGNLLGREQSGHINSIGLELYTGMVEEAVAKLKGEEDQLSKAVQCKLDLGFSYLLPDSYIESTAQRLDMYKRLAELKSEEEMWETRQVLEDRFGRMPPPVRNLFALIQVRLHASGFGLSALEKVGGTLRARFADPERIDMARLMTLLQDPGTRLQLLPEDRLLLGPMPDTPEEVLERLTILEGVVTPKAA